MKIYKTKIKDLLVIKQKNNIDKRGSLRETYNKKNFSNKKFVFEYCTTSKRNVARDGGQGRRGHGNDGRRCS